MGLATAYGPFRPAVYHSFVLRRARGAGEHPRKGYPGMAYQRSRRSLRESYGVTADPSRAGSRMPVKTPSQRDPAAAHEERGVVICGFLS